MSEINFKNSDYPEDVFHTVTDLLLDNIETINTIKIIEPLPITNTGTKQIANENINNLYTSLTKLNISLLEYIHKYKATHTNSPTKIQAPKPIFEYTNITNNLVASGATEA